MLVDHIAGMLFSLALVSRGEETEPPGRAR